MRARYLIPVGLMAALLCLWLSHPASASADDVQVSASVSDDGPDVGESTDYMITVQVPAESSPDAIIPQNINVDGLTITYEGPSSQTQVSFSSNAGMHAQTNITYTYSVVPQRAGDFTIPAQQVQVNGKAYTTQPVSLKVGGGSANGNGGNGGNGSDDASADQGGTGKLFWAEFVLPRNTAYVGEALPIEIRLYVDARTRTQLEEAPEITANGCTVEKTTKPEQSEVTRNGREYVMVTYRTAVTPAKAGDLKIGPVQVAAVAQMPQRRRRTGGGGPFDDPFFQNQFFDDAFQMMSQPQQVEITGDPVPLTALPLPAQGQPRSFSGAVGTFSMSTSVKPTMVEAGDPITVTAKISGDGNFDRVTAPMLTDADGWRTYPPSSTFDAANDAGTSGTKTFQIASIAQGAKTTSPSLEWSYFDPIAGKYVTLTGAGVPIKIEGEVPTAPAPVLAQATPSASQPAKNQASPDIAYIRADSAGWGATFQPLYLNHTFWMAQGAPLLALLAFVGVEAARKRAADKEALRLAQLRKEKEAALSAMQRRDVPESELYQAAARALRLEAAMQLGREPETLDGVEVTCARVLDGELAERVRQLFDQQAEVLYAGTSGGRKAASAETRVAALETVKGYENAKPTA